MHVSKQRVYFVNVFVARCYFLMYQVFTMFIRGTCIINGCSWTFVNHHASEKEKWRLSMGAAHRHKEPSLCLWCSHLVNSALLSLKLRVFVRILRNKTTYLYAHSYPQLCETSLLVEEKPPLLHKLCVFRCLRLQLRSGTRFKYFSEKTKRGSRFSQCCILSTALLCSLPSSFLCLNYF